MCNFTFLVVCTSSRPTAKKICHGQLRLVFTSDGVGVGVGVVSGVVRALMTLSKLKIGVVSGVISATESESEESERFHFFRLRLQFRRLRSAYDLVKTRLSDSEAEAEG